jgi:P27 family predicted phage terminase small subunit|tara:strand:+ start:103 stop:597 length:495 start_codon:yes stop_codon:yes gene_type:complete
MARPKLRTALERFYFSGVPLPDSGTELCTIQSITIPERIIRDPLKKQLWDFIVADMENRKCLSNTYTLLISELVEVITLMHTCREKLDEDGLVVEKFDDEGNYLSSIPNPYFTIMNRQQPMLIKILEKLGLSPRDITYLVSPEASSAAPIEAIANEIKAITYFR